MAFLMRAIATMIWSAGSRGKVAGNCTEAAVTAGDNGINSTNAGSMLRVIHSSSGSLISTRPFSTSLQNSQTLMAERPMGSAEDDLSNRRVTAGIRVGSVTDQYQSGVSK